VRYWRVRYSTNHRADLTVNLPSDAPADAEDASREATRFDAQLGGEIAPFSSVLLRAESAASSNIEDLTASARAIAEAELPGARTTANAKVIVANTAAMVAAINLADKIDDAAILAMHEALMCDVDPKSAGRWREGQVWIGGGTHGWNEKITARSDSAVWQIADLLLRRPVINSALLTVELGIESKHARRYLEPLSEARILLETSSGPRSRVWRSPDVIAALDTFAERARRGGLGRQRK
jgi:Fic family protein